MMDSIPEYSFTSDYLNNLKFRELHKLAVHHKVNKRWAKKQEMIDSLLALKTQVLQNEWRDASEVLDSKPGDDVADDRRLTFNIARETFDVLHPNIIFDKKTLTNEECSDKEIMFNVPTQDKSLQKVETAVDPGPDVQLMAEEKNKYAASVNKGRSSMPEKVEKLGSKIKMLTIPSPRPLRRTRKEKDISTLKISNKSIAIKKPTHQLNRSLVTIPVEATQQIDKSTLQMDQGKCTATRKKSATVNTTLGVASVEKHPPERTLLNPDDKENKVLPSQRRKSRTEDNTLVGKPNLVKVSFLTPPASGRPKAEQLTLPRRTPGHALSSSKKHTHSPPSKIPKAKSGLLPAKPLTATKMPDFARIHKKRFEEMDSLDEFQNKRAERARRLFGNPVARPEKSEQKSAVSKIPMKLNTVFNFGSTQPTSNIGRAVGTNKKQESALPSSKGADGKMQQRSAIKKAASRVHVPIDVKDKSRRVLQGVRTNKRFELQMKFRNLHD